MQVVVKALSVNFAIMYMDFVLICPFMGFSLKNRNLLKNPRGVCHFTKAQILSLTDTGTYISRNTYCPENYYILCYCLLRYFCVLHFASIVITFCIMEVSTFCIESYYILRYYYNLCQLLQYVV